MAIPSHEELDAACLAVMQMKLKVRKLADLLRVARDRGTKCNGMMIPLTNDLIQPLIDEYQTAKAELVSLFQELP